MRQAEAPRTGALGRGAITGLAVARAGIAELGHRVGLGAGDAPQRQARHEAEIGRILFQAMSQLRGTALKVSQILSMEAGFLPEGVRHELARACHQVTPLNRALVGRVFRQSFGQEPEALFDRFEPAAFAAASLGQVHRAELRGQGRLAVKVQYPGIAATIPADMRLLRGTLKALGHGVLSLPDAPVLDRLMDEIEATLQREVDYLQEAEQMQWFAEQATLPGVVCPRPLPSHCRREVLTQQHLDGLHLDDWLRGQPDAARRDALGQRLFDWFMQCAFGLGRLQADLHPGNFLFLHDGRLGVLDFGCTRTLSDHFRTALCASWSAQLLPPGPARSRRLLDSYRRLGLIAADLPQAYFDDTLWPALQAFLDWQSEPFRLADAEGRFDFGRKSAPVHPDRATHQLLMQHLAGMPPEMPAFERGWLGLMHLLSRIGARVDTRNPWVERPATGAAAPADLS